MEWSGDEVMGRQVEGTTEGRREVGMVMGCGMEGRDVGEEIGW